MIPTWLTAVTIWTAVVACAAQTRNDANEIARLSVEPSRVDSGAEVTLTLTNRSEHQLGYNLCPAGLERLVAEDWEVRPERPAEICTMELRILEPGASATYRHTIPAAIPAGTYRFRVGVEWPLGEGQVSLASETFEVG